jgi:NTP pyrophosphatase (non-canonical NTP hydrolase)
MLLSGEGKMINCEKCGEQKEYVMGDGWRCRVCEHECFADTIEPPFAKAFKESLRTMQHAVHENAKAHGWWDEPREDGTVMMLIVSELAELLEELRVGGRESAKIDGFTSEEEELADAVIRILDFAGRKGYRLGAAILAKHEYNLTRPRMHGGKLF